MKLLIVSFFVIICILILLISKKKNREIDIPIPTYYHNDNKAHIYHKFKPQLNIKSSSPKYIFTNENYLHVRGFLSPSNPKIETISFANQDLIKIRRTPWIMKDNTKPIKQLFISSEEPLLFDIAEKYNFMLTKPRFSGSFKDIWLRDEFQVGYMDQYTYIMNGPRNRGLDDWIDNYSKKNNSVYHFHLENACPNVSYNFFGNLMCLNSTKVLYGVNKNGFGTCDRILDFINNQHEQELISIRTDWLAVGHVDEIVSVMPDGKIAMISPKLAIKHLLAMPPNTEILIADKIDKVSHILDKYGDYNLLLDEEMIETSRKKLNPEIHLPMLFQQDTNGKAVALTFNLANVIVDPRFIIAPLDNGPIVKGIPRWGKKLWMHFYPKVEIYQIDSSKFHYLLGGIHCASNEIR